MNKITFFVPGTPIPQGSKNAAVRNGKAYMWEANKNHKAWRDKVTAIAKEYEGSFTKEQPVELHVDFIFDRPRSVPPNKRPHMSVKPDVSKLLRSVEDSITKANVWGDDARVVRLTGQKLYTDQTPLHKGANITIKEKQ